MILFQLLLIYLVLHGRRKNPISKIRSIYSYHFISLFADLIPVFENISQFYFFRQYIVQSLQNLMHLAESPSVSRLMLT